MCTCTWALHTCIDWSSTLWMKSFLMVWGAGPSICALRMDGVTMQVSWGYMHCVTTLLASHNHFACFAALQSATQQAFCGVI